MNILFLTLKDFGCIEEHNIYTDLLREFTKHNHNVYVISPVEKKAKQCSHVLREKNSTILKLRIGNIQKTNLIEKGIATLTIEGIFIKGIKKYFSNIKFDLVLYSTPPITFCKAIDFVKKRDRAKTYLLLKDIFPQNAVDIGILKKKGPKRIIHNYFRNKEKKLYAISDQIGCMSQRNVEFIIEHNPGVDSQKVEISPNSIEIFDSSVSNHDKILIRKKYKIPTDKKVFIYGGNLGKPQGIDFLIRCLKSQNDNEEVFFFIVGDGTEYYKLDRYIKKDNPKNVTLMKQISPKDYDLLAASCDVGMIFLDYRFTIPNFPSRLLTYMQAKMPVFAVTDKNTDIGSVIVNGGFGWWCESNSVVNFERMINRILNESLLEKGENAFDYIKNNYSSNQSYNIIMDSYFGEKHT